MIDFQRILKVLFEAKVRFVIIGGAAAAAHGSAFPTFDLDICYDRSRDNLKRLASALVPFQPQLRGIANHLPFQFDAITIANGMNFTLSTDLGDIDLLGEVLGIGGYKEVRTLSVKLVLFGQECAVLSLDGLIQSKRATGRTKDLLTLPEIEALREIGTQVKPESGLAETQNHKNASGKQDNHGAKD
jgi:hypothetical protein